jgi:hypothetical protein
MCGVKLHKVPVVGAAGERGENGSDVPGEIDVVLEDDSNLLAPGEKVQERGMMGEIATHLAAAQERVMAAAEGALIDQGRVRQVESFSVDGRYPFPLDRELAAEARELCADRGETVGRAIEIDEENSQRLAEFRHDSPLAGALGAAQRCSEAIVRLPATASAA